LAYKAILEQETLRGALLVVSDVTREVERERRDAEQRELINVFERFTRDRVGFMEFFRESEALLSQILTPESGEPRLALRALHTLKGNCGIFGVESVVAVAHRLESSVIDSGSVPTSEQAAELTNAWRSFTSRVLRLAGTDAEPVVEVTHQELQTLEDLTQAHAPHAQLSATLALLKYERGIVRLRRIAEQAKSLAQRLGKGELDVEVEAGSDVRFQTERWAPFWSSFTHVLRNALDHGIEDREARLAAGKPERAVLKLVAKSDARALTIEISDDGRGIDWARVREKARERGLPSASEAELVDALFYDGLSTAGELSEVSGRGVGMSAVRDAAQSLDGVVSVRSVPGIGTTISFGFPTAEATKAASQPWLRAANAPYSSRRY
jgi:two-component system chemotaxis sensor kinase CheA